MPPAAQAAETELAVAFDFEVVVAPVVLVGTNRGNDFSLRSTLIDFGTLTTGERAELNVQVLSNSPYTIQFESENRGVLLHERLDSQVPYTTELNGAVVDWLGPVQRFEDRTGARIDTQHFRFTIGDTSRAIAGDYDDTITITTLAGR
jgi:spore coat protein U-like protein